MLRMLRRAARVTMETAVHAHHVLDNALSGKLSRLEFALRLPLYSRDWLPTLAAGLGLTGTGVEIGVFEGRFSELLLQHSKLKCLYSIDPWQAFAAEDYQDKVNAEQSVWEERLETARQRLRRFGERSKIVRATSRQAAPDFADGSLDLAYIDANHAYGPCKEDLETWWVKLRAGGLFAGDDFVDGLIHGTDFGVKTAVEEFCAEKGQDLRLTGTAPGTRFPNWYLVKR